MKTRYLLALLIALAAAYPARSQQVPVNRDSRSARFAAGINAGDAFLFGTIGINMQYAVHRHWTLELSGKYNNWSWNNEQAEKRVRQAQRSVSFGARWWPWNTYSGWWAGGRAGWQEYSRGGAFGQYYKEEGDAFGAVLSGGYALMLSPHWNADFGLGGWLGYKKFLVYEAPGEACPQCGRQTGGGGKFFLLPFEAIASFSYVF